MVWKCALKSAGNEEVDGGGLRRWRKRQLTWRVTKFPSNGLPKHLVRHALRHSFQVWARHADLDFVEKDAGHVDLEIRWESGRHLDCEPLDGRGGTLAHAYLPNQGPRSGDIHFDDDEDWTLGSERGTDVIQVAVHEIGHSLGLEHSEEDRQVMFPSYRGYMASVELGPEDIRKVQSLYGKPRGANVHVRGEQVHIENGRTTNKEPVKNFSCCCFL